MATRPPPLSGRKELLAWLNNLCNSTYPSVESLRDGAAYCTIIEAAISRVAQNCAATHSPEAPVARSRAEQARVYLSKVDWSATAFVCESSDAAVDPVTVRVACSHNMQLLQDMLQNCVPIEHRYAVDASRLAVGKLQDHVFLLRWLYSFMAKVLALYSRKALEKRSEAVAGSVEGVKLNRTALLRSGQTGVAPERAVRPAAQSRERDLLLGQSPLPPQHVDPARGAIRASPRANTSPLPSSSAREGSGGSEARAPAHAAGARVSARLQHNSEEDTDMTPRQSSPSPAGDGVVHGRRDRAAHSHYTRGAEAIPEHLRDTIVSLRNQVEEVEGKVLYVQEQHNHYLTRPSHSTTHYTPSSALQHVDPHSQLLLDPRETLSLEELGEILEERDALAQQYAAIDAIVTRALRHYQAQGKPISPLLRDLLDLLHPQ